MYCAWGSYWPFSLTHLCKPHLFLCTISIPTPPYTYPVSHPSHSCVLFLAGSIALSRVMNICVQSGTLCIKVCFICIITGLFPSSPAVKVIHHVSWFLWSRSRCLTHKHTHIPHHRSVMSWGNATNSPFIPLSLYFSFQWLISAHYIWLICFQLLCACWVFFLYVCLYYYFLIFQDSML